MRFPGFEGEWKEENIGDLADFKTTNSFSRDLLNYDAGSVKNIHYGDIHTKFQTSFDIETERVPFINKNISLAKISEENYLQVGDLIFADASEDVEDVGKSIEIVNLNNEKVLSGLHTILARPKKEYFYKGFLGFLFKSKSARDQIKKESQGSKVLSISSSRLSKIKISFPSIKEQQKISEFLILIDRRIETQRKAISQTESLMSNLNHKLIGGLLQFNELQKERSRKKIGEFLNIGNGKDYKHLPSGNVPVFGTGGILSYVDSPIHDGETVFIGRKGTINKPFYFKGKFWTVDTLFYTHSFKDAVPKFVHFLFQTINWLSYNEASGVPSLSKSTIEKIEVNLPSIEEQNMIAGFLTKISEKIETEKKILNLLETQKKYLLQKMFV